VIYCHIITKTQVAADVSISPFEASEICCTVPRALGRQANLKGLGRKLLQNVASREAHTALADHTVLTVCLLRARHHVGVKART